MLIDALLSEGRAIRFPVRGRSMRPLLWGGEHVVVVPCETQALRPGDLALWRARPDRVAVLHRVIAATTHGFQTHGDALWSPDPWQPAAALLGKVTRIEGVFGQPWVIPIDRTWARMLGRGVARATAGALRGQAVLARIRGR